MELIDRDALMRKHTRSAHGNRHDTAEELQCLLELIENAPTVDAVKAVRCRDCVHYVEDYVVNIEGAPPIVVARNVCCFNRRSPMLVHTDHYCGWGETEDKK